MSLRRGGQEPEWAESEDHLPGQMRWEFGGKPPRLCWPESAGPFLCVAALELHWSKRWRSHSVQQGAAALWWTYRVLHKTGTVYPALV